MINISSAWNCKHCFRLPPHQSSLKCWVTRDTIIYFASLIKVILSNHTAHSVSKRTQVIEVLNVYAVFDESMPVIFSCFIFCFYLSFDISMWSQVIELFILHPLLWWCCLSMWLTVRVEEQSSMDFKIIMLYVMNEYRRRLHVLLWGFLCVFLKLFAWLFCLVFVLLRAFLALLSTELVYAIVLSRPSICQSVTNFNVGSFKETVSIKVMKLCTSVLQWWDLFGCISQSDLVSRWRSQKFMETSKEEIFLAINQTTCTLCITVIKPITS